MCQFEHLFMSMLLSQRLLGEEFCVLLPGEFRVLPREECRALGADHRGRGRLSRNLSMRLGQTFEHFRLLNVDH